MTNGNPRLVQLGKSPLLARNGAGISAARVIVREGGVIKNAERPQKLRARVNDLLLWRCENKSGGPIRITIHKFINKLTAKPVNAVTFDLSDTVTLQNNEKAFIEASVILQGLFFIRYNVLVVTDAATNDHDPDLEIKP